MSSRLGWILAAVALLLGSCVGDSGGDFTVREVASGLQQPTQMVELDDGRLLIAQLSGAENDKTGSIVAVDPNAPDSIEVWFEGLDKPTGLAVIDDTVWIMERRRLIRGPVGGGATDVVLPGLQYNGRSQGTLTVSDGLLLFNTSGRRNNTERGIGSATIWELDPTTSEPDKVAVGVQNAYARIVEPDGSLLSTDIYAGGDEASFADSLVRVRSGDNLGWPQCATTGEPIESFGGTAATCADRSPPLAIFGTGATPTSIDVVPWDPELVAVALWVTGEVVLVPRAPAATPHEDFTVLYDGFERPQHVLAVGDELFIADHATGSIVAIRPS